MAPEDRYTARVTVNMTSMQAAEIKRIAKKMEVSRSRLVWRSQERTIEEASGGPLPPLEMSGISRDAI
jgi:hypothetical protein